MRAFPRRRHRERPCDLRSCPRTDKVHVLTGALAARLVFDTLCAAFVLNEELAHVLPLVHFSSIATFGSTTSSSDISPS